MALDNPAPGPSRPANTVVRRQRSSEFSGGAALLGPASILESPPSPGTVGRRESQLARILDAMTELVAGEGYPSVTVAKVIARAGVSRSTFYEQFSDKEDCLLVLLAPVQQRLHRALSVAADRAAPERRAASVLATLIDFADADPPGARLLFGEPLTAGQRALALRDEILASFALVIDSGYEGLPADTPAPDLPSRVLVGALARMLAAGLASGDPPSGELSRELTGWLASYQVPLGEHRWRSLCPHAPAPRSAFLALGPLRGPVDTRPGARRLTGVLATQQQRLRIIFATAQLVSDRGYEATTVAEIGRHAGVERATFYRLFSGKREALRAGGELFFGRLMAAGAGAFVMGSCWPERVWEAASAMLRSLQENPTLAKAAIVESHAAGADAPSRLSYFAGTFSIFLEEGFRYDGTREHPSEVCLHAVTTLVFELGYQLIRCGEHEQMCRFLGHIAFFVLAPFLTAEEANVFIEERFPLRCEPTGRRRVRSRGSASQQRRAVSAARLA